jgi:hypothetical protein
VLLGLFSPASPLFIHYHQHHRLVDTLGYLQTQCCSVKLINVHNFMLIPVTARYRERIVLDNSNTGLVDSNPARGTKYVRVFRCCVVLCR